jgi:hypothetical protein
LSEKPLLKAVFIQEQLFQRSTVLGPMVVDLGVGMPCQQKENHWTKREILKAWIHHNDWTSGGLRHGLPWT